MQPVVSCYISCLQAAAVSFRSPPASASPSMRRRQLTPARHPAAAPYKYGQLPRHRFAPPAAISISPDALVYPARESKRQEEKGNTGGEEIIKETKDSVILQFPVTEIVGGDESEVNNAIEVAIVRDEVLTISLKEEKQKQKRQPSLLDVRLLMTPHEKVECLSKKVGDEVWLEVTIKKKAPTTDGTSIIDISAIEEEKTS